MLQSLLAAIPTGRPGGTLMCISDRTTDAMRNLQSEPLEKWPLACHVKHVTQLTDVAITRSGGAGDPRGVVVLMVLCAS